jgi:biopolymer transport protein ExbD
MKITHLLVFTLPLLILGCKKETTPPASQPTSLFQAMTNAIGTAKQPIAVSEWDKVKISDSGDIFVNKKQMSLADFSAECQRLKQAGGGAVLFIDAQHSQLSRAQIEAHQKLVDAGVGMKIVQKESDLE